MKCLGYASKEQSVPSLPASFFLDRMVAAGSGSHALKSRVWKTLWSRESLTISLDFYGKEKIFELFKPLLFWFFVT